MVVILVNGKIRPFHRAPCKTFHTSRRHKARRSSKPYPSASSTAATSAKMNSLGLHTGLDMRNQTLEFMQANFGKAGAYCYWISRGIDNREVRANRIRKSIGAENTFSNDLIDVDAMAAELRPLIDKVWRHCEENRALAALDKPILSQFRIPASC